MAVQTFYGKKPHPLFAGQFAGQFAGRTFKITVSSTISCRNYCEMFILYIQFTNVAAGDGLETHGLGPADSIACTDCTVVCTDCTVL